MRLFTTDDPAEVLALHAIANEAVKTVQLQHKALAAEIANAVSKLFK